MAEVRWYLLQDRARSAAENMALDEALLQLPGLVPEGRVTRAPFQASPVLRFYGWTEPAASFGYFQRYADVEQMTTLRPLVRRPTGGGVVPHDADWTYTLVFPPDHEWYALKARESYKRLHTWIQEALNEIGAAVDIATAARKSASGQCFAGPEQFDVVCDGRKVAGAAQRRTRQGLLIQGSVQPPMGITRNGWQGAMCRVATTHWGVLWDSLAQRPELMERMNLLARTKYSSPHYNQRR
jgi:lipoate-protein ligase A